MIGSGSFGVTYVAKWHMAHVAMKVMKFDEANEEQGFASFFFEVDFHRMLHHPNVVRLSSPPVPSRRTIHHLKGRQNRLTFRAIRYNLHGDVGFESVPSRWERTVIDTPALVVVLVTDLTPGLLGSTRSGALSGGVDTRAHAVTSAVAGAVRPIAVGNHQPVTRQQDAHRLVPPPPLCARLRSRHGVPSRTGMFIALTL